MKEIMASTSIDNEDSSETIIDYVKRVIRWIPNNVNPDLILVVSIFGIIIDGIAIANTLLKLEGINGDLSDNILMDWIEINYRELLYTVLFVITFIVILIFLHTATQRILNENTILKVPIEEFFNFMNDPSVARFYMNLFLMVTGLALLRELAKRSFPVLDTLQFMMAWFILLLLLPIPEAVKSGIDPFTEIDF